MSAAVLTSAGLALLTGLALAFGSGCGSPSESEEGDARAELEQIITQQLPAEARRLGLGAVLVRSVSCVAETETRYSCVARVQGSDGLGHPVTQTLPITGTCDATRCIWRTDTS